MSEHDVTHEQLPRNAGSGGETPAVPAASLIVCRGTPFEVLLLRRNSSSTFVPGAWVFPGGAVDLADREIASGAALHDQEQTALKVCAIRETLEESGLWLGDTIEDAHALRQLLRESAASCLTVSDALLGAVDRLVPTAHWITPVGIPKRYDTWFYLTRCSETAVATVDSLEAVEHLWITPFDALARNRAGQLSMVFPTIKNLEAIAAFDDYDQLVRSRVGQDIPAIQPLLLRDGQRTTLVLPEQS